mgnify:FL=1
MADIDDQEDALITTLCSAYYGFTPLAEQEQGYEDAVKRGLLRRYTAYEVTAEGHAFLAAHRPIEDQRE